MVTFASSNSAMGHHPQVVAADRVKGTMTGAWELLNIQSGAEVIKESKRIRRNVCQKKLLCDLVVGYVHFSVATADLIPFKDHHCLSLSICWSPVGAVDE